VTTRSQGTGVEGHQPYLQRQARAGLRPHDADDGVKGPVGALEGRLTRMHPAAALLSVAVMGYLLISVVFVCIGLLVTHQFGAVTRWDDHVVRWFSENRTGAMNHSTDFATKVADTFGILVVVLVAAIVLFVFRRRWDALFLVVALGLELASFLTVNSFVARPRPDVARLGSLPSTSSFPSGHTAAMIALYGGLAVVLSARFRTRIVRFVSWIVALLATAVVGLARVYRGMHHPSDVAAGVLLGFAVLGVALVAVRTAQRAAAEHQRLHAPPLLLDSPEPELVR
jgi:membrane-associated phospholipid phosphatase